MATDTEATEVQSEAAKLTFVTLTAMVVGSMVGAGVFRPPPPVRVRDRRRRCRAHRLRGSPARACSCSAFACQTLAIAPPRSRTQKGSLRYTSTLQQVLQLSSPWASPACGQHDMLNIIMSTI